MHRYGCHSARRAAWPMAAMMMGGRRGGWGRGGPWGWDDGEGRGGRRGGRGRMFASGELRLLLLKLIADEQRHGYELIKAIEELTGGQYAPSPGVVYPTLSLLLDEGAVTEVSDDAPRKAFAATDAGRAELTERADEAERLVERLKALDSDSDGRRSPPVMRAMGNLFTAVKGRAETGFDRETAHQVAAILDEAAQRIERL